MRPAVVFGTFLPAAMVVALLVGCGGDRRPVAPVEGVVTLDGSPVTSGYVGFSPLGEASESLPGKSAVGAIGSDGRYVLSTYKEGDGAIVGRHRVTVSPTDSDDEGTTLGGALPEDYQVEVKPGENEINLELTRNSRRK